MNVTRCHMPGLCGALWMFASYMIAGQGTPDELRGRLPIGIRRLLYRIYPNDKPNCEGLKRVESWSYGLSDYVGRNGPYRGYMVITLENCDKTFSEFSRTSIVELSGNFLGASVIEALGEALALVAKSGIEQGQYLEFLTSTLFDAPIYKTYGALIASGRFAPAGFAAPLGQKDIRLVLAATEELRVPMPVASLLRDRFLTLLAHGGEELDWSAIGRLPAADAGIAEI